MWCFVHFDLQMCFAPQRRAIFWTSDLQKVVQTCGVLYILTDKCAARHSGVQFFGHLTFKKWSEHVVFCTFWLTNVLRAKAACHFSASELPKWLCPWGVLYILTDKCASRHSGVPFFQIATSKMPPTPSVFSILTWKCASRHSGVPFFISLLNSYLRTPHPPL